MSTFFRGITETVPSLFRGIFRNEIPFPTLGGTPFSFITLYHVQPALFYILPVRFSLPRAFVVHVPLGVPSLKRPFTALYRALPRFTTCGRRHFVLFQFAGALQFLFNHPFSSCGQPFCLKCISHECRHSKRLLYHVRPGAILFYFICAGVPPL
jgi:hypothetical protein